MNWLSFCCVHCQRTLSVARHGLCSYCNKQISRVPYCGCCGTSLAENALHCGYCLRNEPSWNRMVVIGRYNDPLSVLIHRFKFQNQFWLDRTLARLLLLAVRDARCTHQLVLPEVILPVPLHHFRHWRRGYNQADLLTKWLSRWLGIPQRNDLLKRIKQTPTQRGLVATARRQNLRNAFQVSSAVKKSGYQSVVIVDDVITTGATLNEIAKQLRKAGVEQIQVWGLARV